MGGCCKCIRHYMKLYTHRHLDARTEYNPFSSPPLVFTDMSSTMFDVEEENVEI